VATSALESETRLPVVGFVGRPNVGKSTLFSRMAGVYQKTGNWPATTVEVKTAKVTIKKTALSLIDLPGTSSLEPVSMDEQITCQRVLDPQGLDLVVLFLDASNIARCLYLMSQVRELSVPAVVVLTMNDIARKRGIFVDVAGLAEQIGAPVVPVNPRTGQGVAALETQIVNRLNAPHNHSTVTEFHDAAELSRRLQWSAHVMATCIRRTSEKPTFTDRVDRIVTAPYLGVVLLLGVLWLVFQATTSLAAPLQDGLDYLINGLLGTAVQTWLSEVAPNTPWLQTVVVDGIINGAGTLLTFMPIMTIMFVLLAILEDSGYMARAAVVADRVMAMAGLPGRAVLPLLVGFGCNVPAISATRSITDARQRILTGLVIPFTACSARLVVYLFVASIFFGKNAGTVVFAMYVVAIALVVISARIFRLFSGLRSTREPLLIELPPYRLPATRFVAVDALVRVREFLKDAAGIVVITVVVISIAMAIPVRGTTAPGAAPAVQDSAYGAVATAIAPVFAPAGFGDWRASGALITGFVAKEVVIASWAQNYATDNTRDVNFDSETFHETLRRDLAVSSGGFPLSAALAFLIFMSAYTPCVATVAAQKREFGWRWTLLGLATQLLVAWILAVGVFQVCKFLGVG
jgi:ferrous iron transport protein B